MWVWLGSSSVITLGLLAGSMAVSAEETQAPPAATDDATTPAPKSQAEATEPPSPPSPEPPSPPSPVPAAVAPTAAPKAPAAKAQPGPAAASTRPFIILCQDGECVPYSRGCPRGLRFDGERDCVPPSQAAPVDKAAAAFEEEHELAMRMQKRKNPKFTISVEGMGGFLGWSPAATALSLRLLLGYRGQIAPRAGLVLRAGLFGGGVFHDESSGTTPTDTADNTDGSVAGGVVAEIAPYLGPFGRVYVGPLVFLGYFAYDKEALRIGTELLSLESGVTVGLGLHGGAFVGDHERMAIQFSVQGSRLNGILLFTTIGVGFLY